MTEQKRPSEDESGIALLIVMLALLVLSAIAIGLIVETRSRIQEASIQLRASRMHALSDAVILQTAVSLLSNDENLRPRIDGAPQFVVVLGQKVPVTVTSEFGKVDLNAADEQVLTRLFAAAGFGPVEAQVEAEKVIQVRSSHPFREREELRRVPGITADLYAKLAPAVTVYNGQDHIDQGTAPLLALEASGMDRLSAETTIHSRLTGENPAVLSEVEDGKLVQGINLMGWAFEINADVTLAGQQAHLTAVIRITGDQNFPYYTLWRTEHLD